MCYTVLHGANNCPQYAHKRRLPAWQLATNRNTISWEASVLPEIFAKVIEAKELLETGQVRTVADAVACVDISRSAFYKYKDFVSPFQDMSRGHLVTFNLELLDRQGVLSSVLAIFAENGANILTINQSIPTSGVAPVTITAATENMQTTMELFMAALKSAEGVIRVHIMAY